MERKDPIIMIEKAQGQEEPFFILRAQDRFAIYGLLRYYKKLPDGKHKNDVGEIISHFSKWKKLNNKLIKDPD